MKIILWAAIMANGNYMHGDTGYRFQRQVFEDYDAFALEAGNCICGRKTYEEYVGSGGAFTGIEAIVVSRSLRELPGVSCVSSPSEAIRVLEQKGFATAFVAGGDSLLNAFLAANLADEIVFLFTPELGGPGNQIVLPGTEIRSMRLLEVKELGEGIIRGRYAFGTEHSS